MADELKYVEVEEERYQQLLDAERFLDALRAAGVDNWDGYSYAHELLEGEEW